MRKKLICATLIVLAPLVCFSGTSSPNKRGPFDRLVVAQKFLDAIYPDLSQVHGLVVLRAEEFHAAGVDNNIDVVPCHAGSGVPGGGGEHVPTVPHCTGLFLSGPSDFLSILVRYSNGFPIREYYAFGSFVNAKAEATKQQIANHPEWTRQEMTEAVKRAEPGFGPEKKENFSHSIPVEAIYEFTSCRLHPSSASFWVDRLEVKPDPVRVEIQWTVSGNQKDKGRSAKACRATFEPFEGKLLSVEAQ